jgi:hypothetical protein
VLFAIDEMHSKNLSVAGGNIGVNDGPLSIAHHPLVAPSSEICASSVRIPSDSRCGRLFTNDVQRSGPGCGPATPMAPPIFADVAAACGFPSPFPPCDIRVPMTIRRGEMAMLQPGTYGDLRVLGGAGKPAMVVLEPGDYQFCSLRTGACGVPLVSVQLRPLIAPGTRSA